MNKKILTVCVSSSLVISACGGGLLAAFSYIAPIGGGWKSLDGDLEFRADQDSKDPKVPKDNELDAQKTTISTQFKLPALQNQVCNNAASFHLEVDEENLVAYSDSGKKDRCFTGKFTSIHKFTLFYKNQYGGDEKHDLYREAEGRLFIDHDIWVDENDSSHRYVFTEVSESSGLMGCEFTSTSPTTATAVSLWDYNAPYKIGNKLSELSNKPHLSGVNDEGYFEGYANITLKNSQSGKKSMVLNRVKKGDSKLICNP